MAIAQTLGGIATGVLFLTCTLVGVRLLWLAHRTREWPEFCIGAGLIGVVSIGFPVLMSSGYGSGSVAQVKVPLVMLGFGAILFGVINLYAFTWRTFRPTAAWARTLVVFATIACAFVLAGTVRALLTAPADAVAFEVTQGWTAWLRVFFVGTYGWTGIESLLQYRMARRRLALGLSQPVVVNRLLLWGLMGALEVVINAADLLLHLNGLSPMSDGRAMAVTAGGGVCASVLIYLTFLPPLAYREWVERRASYQAA